MVNCLAMKAGRSDQTERSTENLYARKITRRLYDGEFYSSKVEMSLISSLNDISR